MTRYFCELCDYEYVPEDGDPKYGVAPGTAFEDLPDDWECPLCGVNKSFFIIKEDNSERGF
jgi:rubredoxin